MKDKYIKTIEHEHTTIENILRTFSRHVRHHDAAAARAELLTYKASFLKLMNSHFLLEETLLFPAILKKQEGALEIAEDIIHIQKDHG
ncbi:MAG: hemerythrin domain-containing protein, partial [Fibrobacterota bacterium]